MFVWRLCGYWDSALAAKEAYEKSTSTANGMELDTVEKVEQFGTLGDRKVLLKGQWKLKREAEFFSLSTA